MGKPQGPMLDDYAARVFKGVVWVPEEGAAIAGIIMLLPTTNYLLLDNIAVSPKCAALSKNAFERSSPRSTGQRLLRCKIACRCSCARDNRSW
jgi:hypothetical protein